MRHSVVCLKLALKAKAKFNIVMCKVNCRYYRPMPKRESSKKQLLNI